MLKKKIDDMVGTGVYTNDFNSRQSYISSTTFTGSSPRELVARNNISPFQKQQEDVSLTKIRQQEQADAVLVQQLMPDKLEMKSLWAINKCELLFEESKYKKKHKASYKEVRQWINQFLEEINKIDKFYREKMTHCIREFSNL